MPHLTSEGPSFTAPSRFETMTGGTVGAMSWAERAADRSPVVQRSRSRGIQQAQAIVDAARRLIAARGETFTTQELVKEAGVALQTFYRYFAGKDQLLLAVIEDAVTESCAAYKERALGLADPVARIHFYVTVVVSSVGADTHELALQRLITTEHWRLHQLYPDELADAVRPFTDLIRGELYAAAEAGLLEPANPEYDAWLITQLAMAVFHHYAFAATDGSSLETGERLWAFCLSALGGSSS
jgi:TetR/AcrR family transcriptional regulator